MKKQSFISAFALVLLSVFTFSCAQEEILPTPAETAALQNEVIFDPSKVFPLPAEFQQLSEEELIAHLKTMTKEDMDKIAAEYAAQNPVSERDHLELECLLCLAAKPQFPINFIIPGYVIYIHYGSGVLCNQELTNTNSAPCFLSDLYSIAMPINW
ncbi:MAG TPA: hypothetical protein PKA00_08140 [Saprospiraceae bacterium]|nr:hypothetical protein [Saprospiraceae bacterium]HMQ82863.1 hypothetical protein [Saprospiraceae bacterium]